MNHRFPSDGRRSPANAGIILLELTTRPIRNRDSKSSHLLPIIRPRSNREPYHFLPSNKVIHPLPFLSNRELKSSSNRSARDLSVRKIGETRIGAAPSYERWIVTRWTTVERELNDKPTGLQSRRVSNDVNNARMLGTAWRNTNDTVDSFIRELIIMGMENRAVWRKKGRLVVAETSTSH